MAVQNKEYSPRKKKITTTNMRKQFSTFSEAITEMCESSEVIARLLEVTEEMMDKDKEPTIEYVYSQLIKMASEHIPNITKRENMHWEYQIAANNVSIKTGEFISFGWRITSELVKDDDTTKYINKYDFRVTLFGKSQDEVIQKLENRGWKKSSYDKKENKEETPCLKES